MAVRNTVLILLAGCFVCQAIAASLPNLHEKIQLSAVQETEKFTNLQGETKSGIEQRRRRQSEYNSMHQSNTNWPDNTRREEATANIPIPYWWSGVYTGLITGGVPAVVPGVLIGAATQALSPAHQTRDNTRIKRHADGGQLFQERSDQRKIQHNTRDLQRLSSLMGFETSEPSYVDPRTKIGVFSPPQHHYFVTFKHPSNFPRIKRKSDFYSGYQPFQEWSDRLKAEEAKNPPTPEERAEAEKMAKKAGIGMIAGALGGLITGGPPGALTGAFIGAGTGAFSDKIADTLMNKTLPAIYSRYREPMWEMP